MEWVDHVVSILSGLVAAIPLVVALVSYVKKAIKEKNWNKLLEMVMEYMKVAETKFQTGAEKREWVIVMIKASADTLNYDVDLEAVGQMIDSLCAMSKVVNIESKKEETK